MNGKTGGNRGLRRAGSPGCRGSRRRADGGVRRGACAFRVLRRLCLDRVGDLPRGACPRAVHANPRRAGLPRPQPIGRASASACIVNGNPNSRGAG